MRRVMTFRRIAAFGVGMLLLGLLVGGVAGVRARRFAAATFRADDRPAMVALPDDPPATAPPPTAAVATSVPQGLATPRGQAAPVSTATRAPVPVGTPTAAVPPLGYAGTPLSARLRAGRPLALLLLGYGGPGHDGAFLTDSLEVARLDPTSGAITLIGVPRDLWVQIPATGDGRGGYWGKINEAFAVGVGPRCTRVSRPTRPVTSPGGRRSRPPPGCARAAATRRWTPPRSWSRPRRAAGNISSCRPPGRATTARSAPTSGGNSRLKRRHPERRT